jgi:hypothetical protein
MKTVSGAAVEGYGLGTSRKRSRNANHSATTFGTTMKIHIYLALFMKISDVRVSEVSTENTLFFRGKLVICGTLGQIFRERVYYAQNNKKCLIAY